MKRTLILSAMLCVAVAGTQSAKAQRAVPTAITTSIPPGVTARVSIARQRREGRVLRVTTDSLWLADGTDEFSVTLSNIDSVWTLHRLTRRGALVGGSLGAVTLAGLATLLGVGLCESDNCGTEIAGFAFKAAIVGGTGGGLLGAALGSLVREWRRVAP